MPESYELSPLQADMLARTGASAQPGAPIDQVIAMLYEPLDEGAFLRAWERLLERHAILRTRLRWQDSSAPVQEVLERARIPVRWFDWRALAEPERRARLEKLVEDERARGLDPAQAPLMRLALARLGEAKHAMVWSAHQLLLDARSRVILLQELFACYEGKALAPPVPYRAYIEWLRGVDHERSREYWRDLLAGFRAPTPPMAGRKSESGYAVHECRLPATLSAALRSRAREAGITLNVLLQGAWALLLQGYSGEPDIVFGVARDVRPHALAGAAAITGLLMNTLPVRMRVDPDAPLITWLQTLRDTQRGGRDYAHTPLALVHRWSELPRDAPLFETLFIFERHGLDAQLRAQGGAWARRRFLDLTQASYPLALAVYGDEELLLELQYSRRRLDDGAVERMEEHLRTLLAGMAAAPFTPLRDLPVLTEPERKVA